MFKRNMEGDKKIIEGQFTTPELEYLKDKTWIFTEKVDGTNIRIMYDGKDIVFCGRSDNAQLPVPLIHRLDELFKTLKPRIVFDELFTEEGGKEVNVCLYGEGYGARIQKGGGNYKSDGVDFVLFDVRVGDLYLKREDVKEIANALKIDVVPEVGRGTIQDAINMVKKGFQSTWGDFEAEGLVIKPEVELRTRTGERIITKIKAVDFK